MIYLRGVIRRLAPGMWRRCQDRICPGEPLGQRGVQEPGAADGQEADDVGDVAGPGMKHMLQRCARRMNREVQDEQRGGDGESVSRRAGSRAVPCPPSSVSGGTAAAAAAQRAGGAGSRLSQALIAART